MMRYEAEILIEEGKRTEENPRLAKPQPVRSCSLTILETKKNVNDVPGLFHRLREAEKDFGEEQPRVSLVQPPARSGTDVEATPPCSGIAQLNFENLQARSSLGISR